MKHRFSIFSWLMLFLMCSLQPVQGNSGNSVLIGADSYTIMESPPAAGFTFTTSGGCAPVIVQFYSQMSGPSYSWTFGDGGTSPDCNPVHTYTTPGTYTVTLTATGGTYTTTITVGAVPVVTFGGDSVSCQGDVKPYTVSSTIPAASYSWNPIGGILGPNTASSATITWTSYGINYIDYTITTAQSCTKVFRYKVKVIPPPMVNLPCCEEPKRDTIKNPNSSVVVNPNPPHNEFEPGGKEPCSVCAGSYSCYQGSIDPLFGVAGDFTWNWSITNGTIVSISPDSTKCCVVWGPGGTGKITLTITHKIYGCQTVRECEVMINPGIVPMLTVTGTCVNTPVDFDASGTTPLSDVDHFFWEFGDGYTQTTTDAFTTHEYGFTGTYTATVTITTKEGCEYKVSKTFNIIAGTRPVIECPGTVCEGSRQCYTTTAITGATYIWTVTGDVSHTAVGNEVCVTWGTGPVGKVEVQVLGGGYTCTNKVSVEVPIVSSTIPIFGPDYICFSSSSLEVSTTNYSGACYIWKVNGIVQPSGINKLVFNPMFYGTVLNIEVEVDFGLGCCHGKGTKTVTRLPEYTMMFYNDACIGDIMTYNLFFPAGFPTTPVAWSVEGGQIVSSSPTSVTIIWDEVGTGKITAGNNTPTQYCNDANNNTWDVKVWAKAVGEAISGPKLVCAGTTETYYHGFEAPTVSASLSVVGGGAVVTPGLYSSDVSFPASIITPTTYVLAVTYHLGAVAGCDSTVYDTIVAIPIAIPTFSTIAPQCEGDIVTYNASNIDSNYYEWEVIGGSVLSHTYTGTNLSITVQWNSTVTSSITVKNKVCGTSNSQAVTVNGKPVVIISATDVDCTTPFRTLRVAPVWASYSWSTGSVTNTTNIASPGIYSVTISNGVCSNTGSISISVVVPTPPDITSFTVTSSPYMFCPKYNTICGNVTPGTGSIASYSWSFSGFTTASSSLPCPAVALAGMPGPSTGTWFLTVTDSYNCFDTMSGSWLDSCVIDTSGYDPWDPDTPCTSIATFGISYDPCTGQFTSTGTNYSAVLWNFGDNTWGSGFNPTHFYTSPCSKTVLCYVTDIMGCTKVFSFTISVPYVFHNIGVTTTNSPCLGAISVSANGLNICPGSGLTPTYTWSVMLAGTSTLIYSVTTTSSTLAVGSITAIPDGNYDVTVVMNVSGCTRTTNGHFDKGGLKAFFVSCGGCDGSPLTFIDQSIPYTAPLIKWEWTFSGPTTVTSFLRNPTVTLSAGWYYVTLKVTDDVPCTDTFLDSVYIKPPFVPGDILVNGVSTPSGTKFNICPGSSYTLTAPPGVTYAWSNGSTIDSTIITEQGDYYVTVTNSDNCVAKVGPIKFRYKPAPEAIIQFSGNQCASRLLRAFTGIGYTYNWSYPPGPSTSTQPYIHLNTSGLVTLSVANLHGCSATTVQNFTVFPTPTAIINYPTPYCGTPVTLNGNPAGGTMPYTHVWNNGSTASTTLATQPGLYKYKVKDVNGCVAEASLDLQPALPTGMDLLPHGCYDVCGPVNFCTGTMPWGWTGQWFLGSMPYGPMIPQGGNIATTFSMSGTYTLHYTPVNPMVSCPAVSKPITINITALPPFSIIAPSAPAYICVGGSDSVLLKVDSCNYLQFTYTWYKGTTIVGTGCNFYATDSGTYTVRVAKNPCCYVDLTITIYGRNCCIETPNVPFHKILAPVTYTGNMYWEGTYYIDSVVTVLGPNAVLDITNVDCIFGPNGTIVVTQGAFLRTNNSVLRPCEINDIWQGISFQGSSSGWINQTTIKNAIIGVDVIGNARGIRLTDNSFIKCQIGARLTNSFMQQSISGNTFEVDNTQLPYPATPNDYWGIKMYSSDISGLIAQNDFRQTEPQNTINRHYGIYGDASSFTVSENHFNDMFRSIDISNNSNVVTVEKNSIKLNKLKSSYDIYQIRNTNCNNPVLIYENEMDNGLVDNSFAGAIYCANTIRTHVKDNKINGYLVGVMANNTIDLHVASNEITNSMNLGIGLMNTRGSIVGCNTINSMVTNFNTPIGIREYFGDGSSSIYANCIFNMHTAIDLRGMGAAAPLPALYNNYMYNYSDYGIYNINYGGAIGGPGGAVNAGRNTFMSNNGAVGTIDIFSAPGITEGGNFGVLFTVGVLSTTNPDQFYSTAACGQQIQQSYPNNQLDKYNVCDNYNLQQWVAPLVAGGYTVSTPAEPFTSASINETLKNGGNHVVGGITAFMLKGGDTAKQTADAVLASEMERNLAASLIVYNYLTISQPVLATTYLNSPELSTINDDLRYVLNTEIALATDAKLDGGQVGRLKQIDDSEVRYSSLAREVIQAINGDHDYKFAKMPDPEFASPENALTRKANSLVVYPVPASQQITVRHNVKDANVQGLRIVSAIGTEVTSFTYTLNAGEISIDISTLSPGIYTVILATDNNDAPFMNSRFIKQ